MKIIYFTNKVMMLIITLCIVCVIVFGCSTPYNTFTVNTDLNYKKSNYNEYIELIQLSDNFISWLNNSIPTKTSYVLKNKKKTIKINYKRDYKKIDKGSYNNNFYKVKTGDTLFYIAYITGNDFYKLAYKNNIFKPYKIKTGQILIIDDFKKQKKQLQTNSLIVNNKSLDLKLLDSNTKNISIKDTNKVIESLKTKKTITTTPNKMINNSFVKWRWPVDGVVIEKFSDYSGGNKGIDISGYRGQPILAAASGKVVYSGHALRGYGELIIIKHNNEYLSAYAHNDKLFVSEQEDVLEGQKIASMGNTDSDLVKLHFEIRYKGKSVNPLIYLPQK